MNSGTESRAAATVVRVRSLLFDAACQLVFSSASLLEVTERGRHGEIRSASPLTATGISETWPVPPLISTAQAFAQRIFEGRMLADRTGQSFQQRFDRRDHGSRGLLERRSDGEGIGIGKYGAK